MLGGPCRHAWLVCLSNYLHGDHKHCSWSGKVPIESSFSNIIVRRGGHNESSFSTYSLVCVRIELYIDEHTNAMVMPG